MTTKTKKQKKLIPELRFSEFFGEWEEKRLREITKINQGLQIPISERFLEKVKDSYFYITNEFLKKNSKKEYYIKNPPNSVLCDENDILMTRTGNTGHVVRNVSGAFHNNFFKIKYDKEEIEKNFLYEFLVLPQTQSFILRLAGTSTIPDLNHGDFYKIIIHFPELKEQKKIASFLSAVDKKIGKIEEKKALLVEYKKGVIQKIFSQEIRFKDEGEKSFPDWEEKRLGEVAIINPKVKELPSHFIYIDLESVVSGKMIKEKSIDLIGAPSRAQRLLEKEDILFQLVRPYQKNNYFFDREGGYVASTGYAQIRFDGNQRFLYQYLHYEKFVNLVLNRCTGTSYPAINSSDLSRINVWIPDLKEQKKIAEFLTAIDERIKMVEGEIESAKEWKRGLLQKMFV